jgi:hypothetical protein
MYQVYEDMFGCDDTVADTDGDGDEDWYEWAYEADCTDATNGIDDDGDGMYQVYEDMFGCDDTVSDTDGDGVDDWTEWVYGGDCTDPTIVP